MGKLKEGECGCTKKGIQYCKTPTGVRFTGKCPPKEESKTVETEPT